MPLLDIHRGKDLIKFENLQKERVLEGKDVI
jgi:hypothetical protein